MPVPVCGATKDARRPVLGPRSGRAGGPTAGGRLCIVLVAGGLALAGCTTTSTTPGQLGLADAAAGAPGSASAYASTAGEINTNAAWQGAPSAPLQLSAAAAAQPVPYAGPAWQTIGTAPAAPPPASGYAPSASYAKTTARPAYAAAPPAAHGAPVNTDSGQTPFMTGHNITFTQVNPQGFRPWSNAPTTYRIGPGDKLKVKFFVTREMDEDLTVSPDGTIGLRAVGQIRVEGMTLAGVQDVVRNASKKELTDQKVVVSLEEASSSRVYIGGMVAHPGLYRLTDLRMGALQAILLAGGYTDEARPGQVALIRRGPNNEPMLRTINVRDVIESGFDDGDVPLVAGDIVYVPRSSISELDLWIDQFINKVVPFQRSFSYTLGSYSTSTSGASVIP